MLQPLAEIVVQSILNTQADLSAYNWYVAKDIQLGAEVIYVEDGYVILGYKKSDKTQYEFEF
jgi:hypothetical protein